MPALTINTQAMINGTAPLTVILKLVRLPENPQSFAYWVWPYSCYELQPDLKVIHKPWDLPRECLPPSDPPGYFSTSRLLCQNVSTSHLLSKRVSSDSQVSSLIPSFLFPSSSSFMPITKKVPLPCESQFCYLFASIFKCIWFIILGYIHQLSFLPYAYFSLFTLLLFEVYQS